MGKINILEQLMPTLFMDQHLVGVAKPSGIDTGGALGGRSGRGSTGVVEILKNVLRGCETLTPVNRLSRHESGILLLARDAETLQQLRSALRAGKIRQEYVAVVLSKMPRARVLLPSRKVAPKEIGRAPRAGNRRGRNVSTAPAVEKKGAGAETVVQLLTKGTARSFVRCATAVGTTHELRAQLRGAKMRLLGDALNDCSSRRPRPEQTCLHLTKVTFTHPRQGKRVSIVHKCAYAFSDVALGRLDDSPAMQAALVRRLECLTDHATNCYRLLTGRSEGIRGVNVERWGSVLSLEVSDPESVKEDRLTTIAAWYRAMLGIEFVSICSRSRRGARQGRTSAAATSAATKAGAGKAASVPSRRFVGVSPGTVMKVMERGLRYEVHLDEGAAVGLFLDQRDNRSRIRSLAEGSRVLNLFAYTCGFTVAAAAGGAAETVSVDLSARHLAWGKQNLNLNNLDAGDHAFVQSDAAEYLKRARRQGRRFDVIIIDAPTFAHGKKRGQSFSFVRDVSALLHGCKAILAEGGAALVCTNNRQITPASLRSLIQKGIGGGNIASMETPPLPVDFATDQAHSKSILVRLA